MGIVFAEKLDRSPIEEAESGGAVGDSLSQDDGVYRRQKRDAQPAARAALVGTPSDEPRANHHIGVSSRDPFDELEDLVRGMLTVSVELQGCVISTVTRVEKAGLNGSSDPEVEGEVEHQGAALARDARRRVRRPVVDDDDIDLWSFALERADDSGDVRLFVERRDDGEDSQSLFSPSV